MMVKDNYHCDVCDETKSCFSFTEFLMPFAICLECYVKMKDAIESNTQEVQADDVCEWCDQRREMVFAFQRAGITSTVLVCPTCYEKLHEHVENKVKHM